MPTKIDLTDSVFGRVKVLKEAPTRRSCSGRSIVYWYCECICGNLFETRAACLQNGHTRSCGCLQTEFVAKLGKSHFKGKGISVTNNLYRRYKKAAIKRNYSFNLSIEQFSTLLFKNCYYCDSEPTGTWKKTELKYKQLYNGIDRLNNDIGYEPDNVVTCCGTCNKAKMNLSKNTFFEMIKKIYEKHLK